MNTNAPDSWGPYNGIVDSEIINTSYGDLAVLLYTYYQSSVNSAKIHTDNGIAIINITTKAVMADGLEATGNEAMPSPSTNAYDVFDQIVRYELDEQNLLFYMMGDTNFRNEWNEEDIPLDFNDVEDLEDQEFSELEIDLKAFYQRNTNFVFEEDDESPVYESLKLVN